LITTDDFALQLAVERGLISAATRESARQQAGNGAADWLVARGALDRRALAAVLAEHCALPFVALGDRSLPAATLAALPGEFARRHGVCPVGVTADAVQVAVSDPLALDLIDALRHLCDRPVELCVAAADDLRRAIARHYGGEADLIEIDEARAGGARILADDPRGAAGPEGDAPVIRLVHEIIREGVRRRASDIHLEPLADRFRVRYRIDGVLHEAPAPAKPLQLPLVSRVKLMANISIAEKRVPQDGRIQLRLEGRQIDLRVASLPTVHGESIVLRLLDQQGLCLGMSELGFDAADERQFSPLLGSPDGMVLVTGPTGSGKTTTLYACLHHLNQTDRKIITVEDPVEYQLTGINQVPVRAEIGMTFASALRAMLRQAPNVVMVGEIRDGETAEIAINAALTGHLVFSTLHTNDAPGAVARLIDLGAKPFLVAAALRAVVAQRLVRRVCPHCAVEHAPAAAELRALGVDPAQLTTARFRRGRGCGECQGRGYRGRIGIFEIFFITDEIRALIHGKPSAARLRALARRGGMRTLRDDGVRKVLAGLTTIEELLAVAPPDPASSPDPDFPP
jgi:type IV pilus assembly protein PilB